MGTASLLAQGEAAVLEGRRDEAVDVFRHGFQLCVDGGDLPGAVRWAFRAAMTLATGGEPALSAGWLGRAERLLERVEDDVVERGYIAFVQMFRHLESGDFQAAAALADFAVGSGRRYADPDLTSLGLCAQGRLAIYSGRVSDGLAHLDEAMVAVLAGELSPVIAGHVYCTAIEGCQEIGEMGRVTEWTSALTRWCEAQPGLLLFTGQCSVHRGQIMRLRGAWAEAIDEFTRAAQRYVETGSPDAIGLAASERGDVHRLRGEYDLADAAYQLASDHGFDPQPGLALLWLAQGRPDAAVAAVKRLLASTPDPVHRSRHLPAAVDVFVATGDLEAARSVADELAGLAASFGLAAMHAMAAHAAGVVQLASGDAAGSLPYLRRARQHWAGIDSPYEDARLRVLTGRALAVLGDLESSRRELVAAREVLRRLGAAPAADEVDALLHPGTLPAGLTPREVEVLRLVASGRSNTQIAAELVLSEKTVARHLSNIFTKLDVGSRTAAAAYAFEHRLA